MIDKDKSNLFEHSVGGISSAFDPVANQMTQTASDQTAGRRNVNFHM